MTVMADLLTAQADRLRLYEAHELMTRVPAPWIIKDVLRQQSVIQLYGKHGCYKSFVALDLAACITSNIPWQGHEVLRPGIVIYIAAEGSGGIVQRIRAWDEHHDRRLLFDKLFFMAEPAIITATSEDMEWIIHRIQEKIGWEFLYDQETDTLTGPHATWPILIIIDTVARCFEGDENKQADMGQFVKGVDRLKNECRCSVMVIHHTGRKGDHERGSNVLGAACDTIYFLQAKPATQTLVLTNRKMKDSREPAPIHLTYREIPILRRRWDDPDEDLTSVVIEHAIVPPPSVDLKALLTIIGPSTYTALLSTAQSHGMTKTPFDRQLMKLRKSGEIVKKNDKYEVG